ncbi:hypothetical protein [Desulfobacter sp.]|uniref:hypothetical protein n=1 Tax=Desulfobacter sp. TaxID=2294 RepID=UPI003D1230A3
MKIDKKSWRQGYEAGLRQQNSHVFPEPENTEVLSWHAGFLEGQTEAEIKIKIHRKQSRRKEP